MTTLAHPNNRVPEDKFARLSELPSLPALLMDALQQINGNQNMTKLVDKISQDPPVVVRLLRIANSSFYGMPREIASLRDAILLLGLNRVKDLLIGVCFAKVLPERHKDFDYGAFWYHSMAVADCSRQLANHTGISQDIAFTAGLLHDIGRLVLVFLFPEAFSRILADHQPDIPLIEAERRILGFDHVEIGSEAAKHWNFPVPILEAIELHETRPTSDTAKSLGLLVYTANLLVSDAAQVENPSPELQEAIDFALELLNVPIEQAKLLADSGRQFADQIVSQL